MYLAAAKLRASLGQAAVCNDIDLYRVCLQDLDIDTLDLCLAAGDLSLRRLRRWRRVSERCDAGDRYASCHH